MRPNTIRSLDCGIGWRSVVVLPVGLLAFLIGVCSADPVPDSYEVAFLVDEVAGQGRTEVPLTTGVPFPQGMLKPGQTVELTGPDGRRLPVQTAVTGTWRDGSVKWLLLDTQTALQPNAKTKLRLRFPAKTAAPKPRPVLAWQDSAREIAVSTGPLRFVLSKVRPTFIEGAWLDRNRNGSFEPEEVVFDCRTQGGLFVVDQDGTRYESRLDKSAYRAEIEEAGPLRLAVKCTGWHVAPSGARLCTYVLRITAYAGKPYLRLYHTFVFTGDPEKVQVKANGFDLPFPGGEEGRASLGGEQVCSFPASGGRPAVLLQDKADHYAITSGTQTVEEGKRAAGWCDLSGPRGGLGVVVRDFWQLFPKSFEVSADRIQAFLWAPQSGQEINLKRYASTLAESFDDCDVESALGMAKTHDLVLHFHPPGTLPDSLGRWLNKPPLAIADPRWICDSGALGGLSPVNSEKNPKAEQMLSVMFDWLVALVRDAGFYGMLDYGAFREMYNPLAKSWDLPPWEGQVEGKPPGKGFSSHVGWYINEHGFAQGPWLLYARSGERKYFEFAEAYSRNVMDVETCHYSPDYPWRLGGQHRHGYRHCCDLISPCHTYLDYALHYYHLTGYRRALDAAKLAGDFYLNHCQPGMAGMYGHVFPPPAPPSEIDWAGLRGLCSTLGGLVRIYEATWDERYGKRIPEVADILLQGQRGDGTWAEGYAVRNGKPVWDPKTPVSWYYMTYTAEALGLYYELTKDERAENALTKVAHAFMAEWPGQSALLPLAWAYRVTGEAKYLAVAQGLLDSWAADVVREDSPFRTGSWVMPPGDTVNAAFRDLPYVLKPLADWKCDEETRQRLRAEVTLDLIQPSIAKFRESDPGFRVRKPDTGKSLYVLDTEDRPFQITLKRTPRGWANWGPGPADHPVTGKIEVLAPSGKVAVTREFEDSDPTRFKEAEFQLSVPQDTERGTYTIRLSDNGARYWHVATSLPYLVLGTQPPKGQLFCVVFANQFYFYVPAGSEEFKIALRGGHSGLYAAVLYSPDGKVVDKRSWSATRGESAAPQVLSARPAPAQTDKVWSFAFVAAGDLEFELRGVPPYVSLTPEEFFLPDKARAIGVGAKEGG